MVSIQEWVIVARVRYLYYYQKKLEFYSYYYIRTFFDEVTAAPFMVLFLLRENVSADSHKQKKHYKRCSCSYVAVVCLVTLWHYFVICFLVSAGDESQILEIDNVSLHPKYDLSNAYQDISVIKLKPNKGKFYINIMSQKHI